MNPKSLVSIALFYFFTALNICRLPKAPASRSTQNPACLSARFTSPAAFSASALHYSQEELDEGPAKHNMHPADLTKDSRVWLCIDGAQYGLACINGWGAPPQPEHRLPFADRTFEFTISPETVLY